MRSNDLKVVLSLNNFLHYISTLLLFWKGLTDSVVVTVTNKDKKYFEFGRQIFKQNFACSYS